MKLLLLLPALALPFCAPAQAPGYQITGRVEGLADGTPVYLSSGFTRIDSATVQRGTFGLRSQVAEPLFTSLYAGRGPARRKLTDIVLTNQAVTVTGSQADYEHVTVGNSPDTQHFRDWFADDARLTSYRVALSKAYQALPPQDSTAGRLRHLSRLIQQDRVALLKAYVQRYHDSAGGAALPTLCTLGNSLTANDYQEMYHTLAPAWQRTAFGREILAQIRQRQAAAPVKTK